MRGHAGSPPDPRRSTGVGVSALLFSAAALFLFAAPVTAAESRADGSLAALAVRESPWLAPEANSEQRQPYYLGATPREIALGIEPADGGRAVLYSSLRALGEAQAKAIRVALAEAGKTRPGESVTFEVWPVVDQQAGALTWVFARWRKENGSPFEWLDGSAFQETAFPRTAPVFPVYKDLRNKEDFASVYDDVLEMKSLYDKPGFGECLWTTAAGKAGFPASGWLPVSERESHRTRTAREAKSSEPACWMLSQPARLNGRPITWELTVRPDGNVVWPADIAWKPEPETLPDRPPSPARITGWPADFTEAFRRDVLALDGEHEAEFPLSGRKVAFRRKNNTQKDNQLMDMVAYLEERYRAMGIRTERQEFTWRRMPHANLIAVIPGTDPDARPVLMADHFDTAYCEDTYDETGERVSAPGADDNISATATLLRAAEILKSRQPRHEIRLVHLTGEEFPADDLGARHFVGGLLRDKKDIEGLVLLDMIGYREPGDPVFQINPGDSQGSMDLARIALDASKHHTGLQATLRPRFDPRSYLYNTDGIIFSEAGFPVVYINEHMNRLENFWRKGYHHTTDDSRKMDWDYASDIAKVAIETAAVLAGVEPAPQ